MAIGRYRCFQLEVEDGVATLALAHPPINLQIVGLPAG
jgi:hypothetical protein